MKIALALALAATLGAVAAPTTAVPPAVIVYKSPSCGCCKAWMKHLEENGFKVTGKDMDNVQPIKDDLGVPGKLSSCHTAVVDGYVIEGHVPVEVIDRVLAERPAVAGVAVPGMPMGSQGMEMPGGQADHYDIVAFKASGESSVYERR